MNFFLLATALLAAPLLALTSLFQLFYLESMRLRARDYPSLEYFKNVLEDRLGFKTERGALIFSLTKHLLLALTGVLLTAGLAYDSKGGGLALQAGITSVIVVLAVAYVLPQLVYRKAEGPGLRILAPAAHAIALAMLPLAALLELLYSLTELNDREKTDEEPQNQTENIDALISAGAEEGLIEEQDRELMQSVVEFGDKTVREVMTPRPDIISFPIDGSIEKLHQLILNEQFSRIPVFEGTIDKVAGYLHVRDLIDFGEEDRRPKEFRSLIRPILSVPETKPAAQLLREMQADRIHMAMVVDEYGVTVGLVTLEDLVEVIFGEIRDEHEPGKDFEKDGDAYLVAGSFELDRMFEMLEYSPSEEPKSNTVGGLASEWAGHVPRRGETVDHDGIEIEVLAASELRVEKVRFRRAAGQS